MQRAPARVQKVLRAGWVANARGEAPVDPRWSPKSPKSYGRGGLWSALALYLKKLSVADATKNGAKVPPRAIGASVVPTKVAALIARWPTKYPTPSITTGADGTITVPAAAYTFKNRSASLTVMKSYDEGEQVLNGKGDYDNPQSSSFGYDLTTTAAGTFFLTANHTTWHVNQDLNVTVNQGDTQLVPVYYTMGYWNESQPIEVELVKGKNTLLFTRASVRELVLKEFFLYKTKPDIPPPPANYTPVPYVPAPATDRYIAVPATTTCVKQGISEVPEKWCGEACAALGFKWGGARSRDNITACFALVDGEWKGNCNYNSNTKASCETPPCQVEGSTVQNLCLRK